MFTLVNVYVSLMYSVKRKCVVIKLYCFCCFVKRKKCNLGLKREESVWLWGVSSSFVPPTRAQNDDLSFTTTTTTTTTTTRFVRLVDFETVIYRRTHAKPCYYDDRFEAYVVVVSRSASLSFSLFRVSSNGVAASAIIFSPTVLSLCFLCVS